MSVVRGQYGDIQVYGEYSGDCDEEGSEDHWIEGESKIQRPTPAASEHWGGGIHNYSER